MKNYIASIVAVLTCSIYMNSVSAASVNVAIDSSPAGLDPHLITAFNSVIIVQNNIYEGLTVYEQDTNRYYVLVDTSNVSNAAGWDEIATGNSFSGSTTIGSDLLNIHNITGSVSITGSLELQNSNLQVTGSLALNLTGVSKYFNISMIRM